VASDLQRRGLHDLNSALQVITGNVELLQMSQPLTPAQCQLLAAALAAAQQAARLVNALQHSD
jgi:signal transduction histidine kinase